jgi:hypothetical protein
MKPKRPNRNILKWTVALLFFCLSVSSSQSYSVLTHEEIIDLVWKDQFKPLLLKRFPATTDDQLREAHAYAYGGSLVQDMGYYPFGSHYFSDLVHYVRTGDFVEALLRDSTSLDEYAFALGALAHYSADNAGHPTINKVVAIEFPKLKRKFGNEVTYADDPKAHIQTEFGFDMVQVAKNRYTSDSFHDFIGFEVAKPLLERAFQETYNIPLSDVIANEDLAIGTFRRSISRVIPEMTRVALLSRRKEIVKDTPNFSEKEFLYHLSRADYQKQWGNGYRKPDFGARVLSVILRIMPKIGPFRAIAFKIPSPQTEDLYIKSINTTVDGYQTLLRQQAAAGRVNLDNLDFDTGRPGRAGEYVLADKTYAHLLDQLAKNDFTQTSPELRTKILGFYEHPEKEPSTKTKPSPDVTKEQLEKLRLMATNGTNDQPNKIASPSQPK